MPSQTEKAFSDAFVAIRAYHQARQERDEDVRIGKLEQEKARLQEERERTSLVLQMAEAKYKPPEGYVFIHRVRPDETALCVGRIATQHDRKAPHLRAAHRVEHSVRIPIGDVAGYCVLGNTIRFNPWAPSRGEVPVAVMDLVDRKQEGPNKGRLQLEMTEEELFPAKYEKPILRVTPINALPSILVDTHVIAGLGREILLGGSLQEAITTTPINV